MKKWVYIFACSFLFSCEPSEEAEEFIPEIEAVASIYAITEAETQDPTSSYLTYDVSEEKIGTATFQQAQSVVLLTLELHGQTPGSARAVHIHNGDLTKPLRHWNQQSFEPFCDKKSLGSKWAKTFAGDVGNVPIDELGNGFLTIRTDFWALNSGDEKDLLDKIIVVHQEPEDFVEECNPNHDHNTHLHSNEKIGGGIIQLSTPVERNLGIKTAFESPDFTVCK